MDGGESWVGRSGASSTDGGHPDYRDGGFLNGNCPPRANIRHVLLVWPWRWSRVKKRRWECGRPGWQIQQSFSNLDPSAVNVRAGKRRRFSTHSLRKQTHADAMGHRDVDQRYERACWESGQPTEVASRTGSGPASGARLIAAVWDVFVRGELMVAVGIGQRKSLAFRPSDDCTSKSIGVLGSAHLALCPMQKMIDMTSTEDFWPTQVCFTHRLSRAIRTRKALEMASQLPTFPRVVFTIIEPISLIAGAVAPFISPDWFIEEQISTTTTVTHSDNSRLVALQLGNAYGLLFMLGVAVLYTTSELKVVRNYLWALWIADLGHIAFTAYLLGYDRFTAVGEWNAMTWGNVGATAFLCLTRSAYLLGMFHQDTSGPLRRNKTD
ncbi:hypothetical protein SUNI508_00995 [Seiridium unicorne]|uniref:DUF7704 domain-containing protein n=1 Tax=Seiridium unicorne TaxID=138068 RepID=A0ABR2V1V9_9PEZI